VSDPDQGKSNGEPPLAERIAAFRRQVVEPSSPAPAGVSPFAQGMRAASELAAAVLVGAGIGVGLDYLTGRRPIFSIAFFLLGVVAGMINVVRATSPKGRK
jgi:ATP synthase protein I